MAVKRHTVVYRVRILIDGCPCDSWNGCAARTEDWKLKSEGQLLIVQNNYADPIMVNFDGMLSH